MLPGLAVDYSKKQQTVIFCMRSEQQKNSWMLQTKQRKIQILRISTCLSRDKYQVLFCVSAKTRNCDDQTMRDRLIELSHGRAMD